MTAHFLSNTEAIKMKSWFQESSHILVNHVHDNVLLTTQPLILNNNCQMVGYPITEE